MYNEPNKEDYRIIAGCYVKSHSYANYIVEDIETCFSM